MTSTIPAPRPIDTAPAPVAARPARLDAVDLLRGLVMVIMVLDHTRDFAFSGTLHFAPTDLTRTTPAIFFTRWITHFCAPTFVFLAGTSIFFYARKHAEVSKYLLIRGVWLIFLELTFLRVAWTFNFDFMHYEMAGVIWVIGCCMILMTGLVKLPLAAVGTLG